LTQRKSLDAEAQQLAAEFNRIAQVTEMNGLQALNGTVPTLITQAGYGDDGQLSFAIPDLITNTRGTGELNAVTSYGGGAGVAWTAEVGDLNGDGFQDVITPGSNTYIRLGNGAGTFKFQTLATGATNGATFGDLNGDGQLDVITSATGGFRVYLNQGGGTLSAGVNYTAAGSMGMEVAVQDVNGDGAADLVSWASNGSLMTALGNGNGNGTFKSIITSPVLTSTLYNFLHVTDLNNDGKADAIVNSFANSSILVAFGTGNGTFGSVRTFAAGATAYNFAVGDIDLDGDSDVVITNDSANQINILIGNGDGSFNARVSIALPTATEGVAIEDLNGDAIPDLAVGGYNGNRIYTLVGNGDGTFRASVSVVSGAANALAVGDFNGDGANDVVSSNASGSVNVHLARTTQVQLLPGFTLKTQDGALEALDLFTTELTDLVAGIGRLGASLSRLDFAANNLQSMRINYEAAASQILDVDVAEETAQLSRGQILQRSAQAILAQANQVPALVLTLLGR